MAETFQEKVCAYFGVPADQYVETVLRLTLYPQAHWWRFLPGAHVHDVDLNFVAAVGRLGGWRGFSAAALDFQGHPENLRFSRQTLRLRISVFRMCVLFSRIWEEAIPADAMPSASLSPVPATSSLLPD